MMFLLYLPDNWVLYKTTLHQYFADGRDSIASGWDELEKCGYVVPKRLLNENGTFAGWNYEIIDIPIVTPITENPKSDNPTSENPTLYNTLTNNTVYSSSHSNTRIDTSVNPNTLHNPNTLVPDENDLFTPEMRNEMEGSRHLAPQMVSIFLKKNPHYQFFKETDYKAVMEIAKLIAAKEGISQSKMLGMAPMQIILEKWTGYVNFMAKNEWFAQKSLSQLASKSMWQSLIQTIANPKKNNKRVLSAYEQEMEDRKERMRGSSLGA